MVEPRVAFRIDRGVRGHEVHSLSDAIDYVHDCVIAMCVGKLNHEVNSDCIPSLLWSLHQM